MSDEMISPIANQLLECLRTEVQTISEPPTKIGFRQGNLVAVYLSMGPDECCQGLAWVRWAAAFPSTIIGQPLEQPHTQGRLNLGFWTIQLEMGIARCAPVTPATTNPTAEAWDAVSELVFEDQAAMRRAYCCFNELPFRKGNTIIVDASPYDTEGGCTGSTMLIATRGPSCEC